MRDEEPRLHRIGSLSAVASISNAKCTIEALPSMGRFVLRLPSEASRTISHIAGMRIDVPINQATLSNHGMAARLGPDEWLFIVPEASIKRIQAEAASQLTNTHHALIDISHRNSSIKIAGAAAVDVLAAGCPIDFGGDHFRPHAATRTLMGRAEIVLWRLDDTTDHNSVLQPCFHLECWRSFGRYVFDLLREVAREHNVP